LVPVLQYEVRDRLGVFTIVLEYLDPPQIVSRCVKPVMSAVVAFHELPKIGTG